MEDEKVTLIGIINGVDVFIDIDREKTIADFVELVCTNSNNMGRSFDDWIVLNTSGETISRHSKTGLFDDGERFIFHLDYSKEEKIAMKSAPVKDKIVLCAKEITREMGKVPTFGGSEADKRLGELYLLVKQLELIERGETNG